MPLTITPNNLQAQYGEKFDDKITLSYAYDNSKVENNQSFLNTLKLDHKSILAENCYSPGGCKGDCKQVSRHRQC
jgi:hypothetical protein